MIDTHAHINTEAFDEDREEIIRDSFSEGLEYIIIPAIEPKEFQSLFDTANMDPRIYCGIGIHPHNANEVNDETLRRIEELSESEKVVAIGEIGLDYFYDFNPKELQQEAFRKQLQIAKRKNLPVIIHNRESDEDLIRILEEEQNGALRGVLHCFSGDLKMLEKALEMGFHVSFTGNITFKKTKLAEIVKAAHLEKIMIETDSPYMTPVPFRGKRNRPSLVKYVAEKIAEYKSISINEVISMTSENAKKLFKLSVLALIFSFSAALVYGQEEVDDETGYYEDDEFLDEQMEEDNWQPFNKTLGFGPVVGFLTVVETRYLDYLTPPQDYEETHEGIVAFGGNVSYSPLNFLILDLTYLWGKDTKTSDKWDGLVEPSTYQVIELSSHWISNPNSRINIYAMGGANVFLTEIGGQNNTTISDTHFGVHFGLGFMANIETGYGLITPKLEWRVDFAFGRGEGNHIEPISGTNNVDVKQIDNSIFFSIPRVVINWCPDI